MSCAKTRLFLVMVVLGCALVTACSHGRTDRRTDSSAPTPTSARSASTMAATVAASIPTSPAGRVLTAVPPTDIKGLELAGYLGTAQAQAVFVQGNYAYVGFGIELASEHCPRAI